MGSILKRCFPCLGSYLESLLYSSIPKPSNSKWSWSRSVINTFYSVMPALVNIERSWMQRPDDVSSHWYHSWLARMVLLQCMFNKRRNEYPGHSHAQFEPWSQAWLWMEWHIAVMRVSSSSILAWENSHDIVPSLAIRLNPNDVVDHMCQSTRHFYHTGIRISASLTPRLPIFVAQVEQIERTQGFNQTIFNNVGPKLMDRHRPFVQAMFSLYLFQYNWPWQARFSNEFMHFGNWQLSVLEKLGRMHTE